MSDKLCISPTEMFLYSPSNIAHVLVATTLIFLEITVSKATTNANIIDPANSISSFDQLVLSVLVIMPPKSLETYNKFATWFKI